MSSYTHVLYKSDAIFLQYENDNYSVKANVDIMKGTLVLLEHVASGTQEAVLATVMTDKSLFNDLFPREANTDARAKVSKNAFQFEPNFVIGNFFSKFNHSCIPTCHMDIADKLVLDKYFDVHVYGMWTHRNIKAGDELTIDYVNGNGDEHNHYSELFGFKCECTKEYIAKSLHRANIHKNLGDVFRKNDEVMIQSIVNQYAKTKTARDIMTRHYLAKQGYFDSEDALYVLRDPNYNEDHEANIAKIKANIAWLFKDYN